MTINYESLISGGEKNDGEFAEKLKEMSEVVKELVDRVNDMPPPPEGLAEPPFEPFFGKITASARMDATDHARWNYTVQPVILSDYNNDGYADDMDPLTKVERAVITEVLNIREMGHIAYPGDGATWRIWGVNVHSANYPASFQPCPVGGGYNGASIDIEGDVTFGTHTNDTLVLIHVTETEEYEPRYFFDAMGSHDGLC